MEINNSHFFRIAEIFLLKKIIMYIEKKIFFLINTLLKTGKEL